jgi:hypothetical protein
LQLGLSGFHATFVTMDSAISKAAIGLRQIAGGVRRLVALRIMPAPGRMKGAKWTEIAAMLQIDRKTAVAWHARGISGVAERVEVDEPEPGAAMVPPRRCSPRRGSNTMIRTADPNRRHVHSVCSRWRPQPAPRKCPPSQPGSLPAPTSAGATCRSSIERRAFGLPVLSKLVLPMCYLDRNFDLAPNL